MFYMALTPDAYADSRTISIVLDGQQYSLHYGIWNGTILASNADLDRKAITLRIDATDNGKFLVHLPSDIIQSRGSGDEDIPFIIRVNGSEVAYVTIEERPQSRIIEVPFSKGDSEIEIMGTWIVPEFPTVNYLILALPLIVVIALLHGRHIVRFAH